MFSLTLTSFVLITVAVLASFIAGVLLAPKVVPIETALKNDLTDLETKFKAEIIAIKADILGIKAVLSGTPVKPATKTSVKR